MIKDKLYSTYLDAICDKVDERTVELSGIPPLSFTAKGKPLTAWSITGNTVQNGTPTPENPVEVQAVGDRTGNLFDPNSVRYHMGKGTGNRIGAVSNGAMFYIKAVPNTEYTLKIHTTDSTFARLYLSNAPIAEGVPESYNVISESETTINPEVTISNTNYTYLWIQVGGTWYTEHGGTSIMLNTGSTALPYESYGYKIPFITSAEDGSESITTPIYLPTPLYSGEAMRSDGTIARSDGTTETFTAPQIPTLNGTTVIDVDTAVKPESMTIKYKAV